MLATAAVLMGMAAQGGVVSQEWRNGKLALQLDDGSAELEWISTTAFRFTRSWGDRVETLPTIVHESITPEMLEDNSVITLRSRYLRVELSRSDLNLRLKNGETPVTSAVLEKTPEDVKLRLGLGPNEKVFGLTGGESGRLNLRGERLERERGFMFTSAGYGIFVRSPERCVFDLANGTIGAPGA